MTNKKKIYLSLDDLHKLYGISPEQLFKKKKKNKKKKNTNKSTSKDKTSSFGKGTQKQFGGSGEIGGVGGVNVLGSSIDRREIDILRGHINEARNNPNKQNDGILKLENVPEELKETFKFAKVASDAFNSGNASMTKTNGGKLIMKETKQPIIKPRKGKTFDLSTPIDNTINDPSPLKSVNDVVEKHPFISYNEDVPDNIIESKDDLLTITNDANDVIDVPIQKQKKNKGKQKTI